MQKHEKSLVTLHETTLNCASASTAVQTSPFYRVLLSLSAVRQTAIFICLLLFFGLLGKSAAAKACSRCKVVRFCSKECQVESWPLHKQTCQVAQVVSPAAFASPSSQAEMETCESKQKEAEAQYKLGLAHAKKQGAKQHHEKAVNCFKEAAEQGHADAQALLGAAFFNGKGVAKNNEEAAKWLKKAAEQGHAGAQYNLGMAFYDGEGVAKNLKETVK